MNEESCSQHEACQKEAFEAFIFNLASGFEGEGFNVRRISLDNIGKDSPYKSPFPAKEDCAMSQFTASINEPKQFTAPINEQKNEEFTKWSIADLLAHEAELRKKGEFGRYRRAAGQSFPIQVVLNNPEFDWFPIFPDITKTNHFTINGKNDSVCFALSGDKNAAAVRFTIDSETKKIKDVVLVRGDKS
ncbi:hypothetical protein [Ferrovum sp.]|uniref:hypothetical protein n=1 Tax=Ferrovum sp. TaxID=2609467 RepID=UPI00260772F3|nr:hypothetical protein [Ferrovum sp.]